jgi:Ni2+-binding GTPase involved in maturation of urease and hydrogenase
MIKITIEGPAGSGKTQLAKELMLHLATKKMSNKVWIKNEKPYLVVHDGEGPNFKRQPYQKQPDILIITKQR